MSIQLIQQYYSKVDQIIRYGGSRNESSLRKPFQDLLEQYARAKGLVLVAEVEMTSRKGTRIRPDGVLKDALRQDWGYWESKDEKDDIEAEILAKIGKGYPLFNILFEDTKTAILYQDGERVLRVPFSDAAGLDRLLTLWAGYEPREVAEFHKAIALFSQEIGGLAEALRSVISEQLAVNREFGKALAEFLELCQKAINPKIEMADAREMVIQHVLTEDIFMRVFDEAEFHRENVIARKLAEVAGSFYRGETKRNIHARIAPYYEAINARAAQISDHHEKQKFLKALYESFYRAYNPKAADRLGIVYTPDEIVRFMIESADTLVHRHFGKGLGERGVEILDPATGTGTFITELIEYLPPQQLAAKYEHEIHCNEVSILPYYIANLNIEYTYKQKMGQFKEFENICFVDTLDNMGFEHSGQQLNFFGLTDENAERITRQNSRPIMLVIGNPPYNANQANENDNNKNREYPDIDRRIRDTYVKYSTAQKLKVYDMYTRFLRWATDRISSDGIVAFITNNSFVDARGFDGFRKAVLKDFNEVWIVDLGGNARKSEKANVFNIQLGVAISFWVKNSKKKGGCKVFYTKVEADSAREKLAYLSSAKFDEIKFEHVLPDNQNNWIDLSINDFGSLLPLESKKGKQKIFDLTSNGVVTNRDEWVYDFSKDTLEKKSRFFMDEYNHEVKRWKIFKTETNFKETSRESSPEVDAFLHERNIIKWSKMIKRDKLRKEKDGVFNAEMIRPAMYRPYVSQYLYFDYIPIDMPAQFGNIFPSSGAENAVIWLKTGSAWPYFALAINKIPDLLPQGGSRCFPLYKYVDGERTENITDWALAQFKKHYRGVRADGIRPVGEDESSPGKGGRRPPQREITKQDIFHYVYAVLHHPAYRAKYEINLKREFPRIPFYEDFHQWAAWGERLMSLHLGYETVEPFGLERIERRGAVPAPADGAAQPKGLGDPAPTVRLIARKEQGIIEIDTITTLRGVPPAAWEYRLGTYSALEWVLERYKEKKPKDPTIAEKFNTYRFADYKEAVIELLGKVCRVSVETMKIIEEMPK